MGNYCPFANGLCHNDCVFKINKTSTTHGISDCLIAVKLDDINGYQHDDLTEIISATSKN